MVDRSPDHSASSASFDEAWIPPLPHPRTQMIVLAEAEVISGDDPNGLCEIAGVGPIPRSELERLACNAAVFGLIFGGDGQPLWLGQENRLATPDQWRALVARDRACVLCGAAPVYCEAHHMVPFQPPARGPTNIENLALLCVSDHHRLHGAGLVLVRAGPGQWSTVPGNDHRLAA